MLTAATLLTRTTIEELPKTAATLHSTNKSSRLRATITAAI